MIADPATVPGWSDAYAANEPGHTATSVPIFLYQGEADQIIPVGVSATLLKNYCALGVPVSRKTYPGADHTSVIPAAVVDILAFANDRLAGKPAPVGCSRRWGVALPPADRHAGLRARSAGSGPPRVGRARPTVLAATAGPWSRLHPARSRGGRVNGFVAATAVAFGAIFVAEMGDKSQLMALAFATRFRAGAILLGITIATAAVHAVSVGIGAVLQLSLPTRAINIAAGLLFFGFAAWTLRGDTLTEADEERVERAGGRSAVVAASLAFFLSELGDKTMLATITLATTYPPLGVWVGSTLGMVAADGLAIVVGRVLGTRLPERAVRIGAAVLFVLFGVALLAEGTP